MRLGWFVVLGYQFVIGLDFKLNKINGWSGQQFIWDN